MKKVLVMLLFMGLLSLQASAVIYVDAEGGASGNTVNAATGSNSDWYIEGTANDGLWGRRLFGYDQSGVFNGATKDIFEASGTIGAENCMTLITTASGLTVGQLYSVEVVYWSSDTQNWNVRAGFDAGSMILFDRDGSLGIAGTKIAGTRDGDRDAYTGLIGSIAADANGQIRVYLDDLPGGGWYDRSWYDGLIFNEVPEPATCALLILGGLMSLRHRR